MIKLTSLMVLLIPLILLFTLSTSATSSTSDSSGVPEDSQPSTSSISSASNVGSISTVSSMESGSSEVVLHQVDSSSVSTTSEVISQQVDSSSVSATSEVVSQQEDSSSIATNSEVSEQPAVSSEPEMQTQSSPLLVSPPPTAFTSTMYYNPTSPLGIAGSFHLVGFDSVWMQAHTNGNVLTNTLYTNSNFGTNNLADEMSYIVNYTWVNSGSASSLDHILVLGSSNSTELVDNGNAVAVNGRKLDRPKTVWQDDAELYIDLSVVKSQAEALSTTLRGYENSNITTNLDPSGGSVDESYITLTDPNNGGVFSTTAAELSTLRYLGIKGFMGSNKTSVIINVDCQNTSSLSLPISLITIDNIQIPCSETHIFTNGRVLWNFYNLLPNSGTTIDTALLHGSILATDAWVGVMQNLNGTVIANNISINAESHRDDFIGELPSSSTPLTLTINKDWINIDGSPLSATNYSATIQLLQDSAPFGSVVTLNESNGFSHTFEDLPSGFSYTVREQSVFYNGVDVTDNFTVTSLEQSADTVLITNSLKDSEPTILPATGESSFYLLAIGIILIIFSAILLHNLGDKYDDD